MNSFQSKRVLITGASQGLGAVAAKAYAERGATVAMLGRQIDKLTALKEALPFSDRHATIKVDLMDPKEISQAVSAAVEHLGGIDVVLHAAGGGLGLRDPLLAAPDLQRLFTLNVAAGAEINRLVVPHMKGQGGNLVHVGSIASYEAVGSVGYNTAKAGLAAYVRSLGRELAGDNIIVTGILPGGFHAVNNAMDRLLQSSPDVYKKFVEERLPRKRMGDASELIPIIMLLSSSDASMMGGCLIPIDAAEGKAYQIDSNL